MSFRFRVKKLVGTRSIKDSGIVDRPAWRGLETDPFGPRVRADARGADPVGGLEVKAGKCQKTNG
jgi:hypothetical protein